MAKYPFKINITKGDGSQVSYYTSSFANSAMTFVSSSEIVTRINAIPLGDSFLQSEEAVATSSGNVYNDSGQGATFLSVSTNDPMSGSITFTDTETTTNGGLDNYTFFGTKVCSVLGIPEGIPIYTENFRLSDDSNNPDNYLSGDVIADSVSIKTGFKISPQGRMRSNLVWDEIFGEGILQWVSGSASKLRLGYDDVDDKYIIKAAGSSTFEISGVDTLASTVINNVTNLDGSGRLDISGDDNDVNIGTVGSGIPDFTNSNRGAFKIDYNGSNIMCGHLMMVGYENSPFEDVDQLSQAGTITHDGQGNVHRDYQLNIINDESDDAHNFAGISFYAGTDHPQAAPDYNADKIGASIAAVRDISADGNASLGDHNLVFCTNDASDDGNRERLVIFHDGEVRAKSTVSASLVRSSGDVVAFYTSDERLKDNIETIDKPIYKLKQLRGVEYEWNGLQDIYPSGSRDSGIIAQDVQKVLPQLVKENSNGYLGVRHDRLVGLLVESIKDQQKQIDELKENSHEPQNYKEQCEKMQKELDKLKQEVKELKNG